MGVCLHAGRSPLHCAVYYHGRKLYGIQSENEKIDSSFTILELVENGADLNLPVKQSVDRNTITY
jgi:hypothetical protein